MSMRSELQALKVRKFSRVFKLFIYNFKNLVLEKISKILCRKSFREMCQFGEVPVGGQARKI